MQRILKAVLSTSLVASALVAIPLRSHAQTATTQATTVKEEKPGLLAQAKVTPATASATALARVPGGAIRKSEIEREDGRLVYSFDIAVRGRKGVEEVLVDATTGTVISVGPEKSEKSEKSEKGEHKAGHPGSDQS